MFCCVRIKNSAKYLIIRHIWIENFDEESIKNYGFESNKNKLCKFFYSENKKAAPDFNAVIESEFCGEFCYRGYVVAVFSKHIFTYYRFQKTMIINYEFHLKGKESSAISYLIRVQSKENKDVAEAFHNALDQKVTRIGNIQKTIAAVNRKLTDGEPCEFFDIAKEAEELDKMYNSESDSDDDTEENGDDNELDVNQQRIVEQYHIHEMEGYFSGKHLFYISMLVLTICDMN